MEDGEIDEEANNFETTVEEISVEHDHEEVEEKNNG